MAKQRINVLSRDAIEKLRQDHEQLRVQVQQLRQMVRALTAGQEGAVFELGRTDGSGISAMSGDTPGSGTITPYRLRGGGTITALSHDETCYNVAGSVAADTYIGFLRDAWGRPWAIVEDCG